VDVGTIAEYPTGPTCLASRRPRSFAERCYRASSSRAQCAAGALSSTTSAQSHRRLVMSILIGLRRDRTFSGEIVRSKGKQS
jgi:hypothetical protein